MNKIIRGTLLIGGTLFVVSLLAVTIISDIVFEKIESLEQENLKLRADFMDEQESAIQCVDIYNDLNRKYLELVEVEQKKTDAINVCVVEFNNMLRDKND